MTKNKSKISLTDLKLEVETSYENHRTPKEVCKYIIDKYEISGDSAYGYIYSYYNNKFRQDYKFKKCKIIGDHTLTVDGIEYLIVKEMDGVWCNNDFFVMEKTLREAKWEVLCAILSLKQEQKNSKKLRLVK